MKLAEINTPAVTMLGVEIKPAKTYFADAEFFLFLVVDNYRNPARELTIFISQILLCI